MRKIFFTPGPSQIFPPVEKHIKEANDENIFSLSHRSKAFEELFAKTTNSLKTFLNIPKDHVIFFFGSATEAIERITQNTVEKQSLHFVNGAFSKLFFQIAKDLKKSPIAIERTMGEPFQLNNISIPKTTELIAVTHNESSTGFCFNLADLYNIKKHHPQILSAIDVVSSIPYVNINYNLSDCVFFSVQKGFGLPAGLGVLILSPQAIEKSDFLLKKGVNIGSYHNFPNLLKFVQKNQTPETPNVLDIYLLNKVIEDMQKIGINRIRKQTEEKAQLLFAFFENHPQYNLFIKDSNYRSKTVIAVEVKGGSEKIISKLLSHGIIVGEGYGIYKKTQMRIANFPAITMADVKKLISLLE